MTALEDGNPQVIAVTLGDIARAKGARYIDPYNQESPHQSLDYRTPHQAFLNPQPAA